MATTATSSSGVMSFQCTDPANFQITEEHQEAFNRTGFLLVRGLLDEVEQAKVKKAAEHPAMRAHCYGMPDGQGKFSRMVLWNHPGDDFTGRLSRCEKVAGSMERLLGGEVYHYHTKLMMKEAEVGGSQIWHQDYGYWYNNGCLFPDMGTVFMPVDACTKENGCLEVIEGSHKCGRIEHNQTAGQMGADVTRLDYIRKRLPHHYVEMAPGDALFFHCTLLHGSAQNLSAQRRYALVFAYNRASNDPVFAHHHASYSPLHKITNAYMHDCDDFDHLDGKDFFDPFSSTTKGQIIAVKMN